jgi:hypothetical protein
MLLSPFNSGKPFHSSAAIAGIPDLTEPRPRYPKIAFCTASAFRVESPRLEPPGRAPSGDPVSRMTLATTTSLPV